LSPLSHGVPRDRVYASSERARSPSRPRDGDRLADAQGDDVIGSLGPDADPDPLASCSRGDYLARDERPGSEGLPLLPPPRPPVAPDAHHLKGSIHDWSPAGARRGQCKPALETSMDPRSEPGSRRHPPGARSCGRAHSAEGHRERGAGVGLRNPTPPLFHSHTRRMMSTWTTGATRRNVSRGQHRRRGSWENVRAWPRDGSGRVGLALWCRPAARGFRDGARRRGPRLRRFCSVRGRARTGRSVQVGHRPRL
jgi:hypothetical protein